LSESDVSEPRRSRPQNWKVVAVAVAQGGGNAKRRSQWRQRTAG